MKNDGIQLSRTKEIGIHFNFPISTKSQLGKQIKQVRHQGLRHLENRGLPVKGTHIQAPKPLSFIPRCHK